MSTTIPLTGMSDNQEFVHLHYVHITEASKLISNKIIKIFYFSYTNQKHMH